MGRIQKVVSGTVLTSLFLVTSEAHAQDEASVTAEISSLREELRAQRQLIEAQAAMIARQQAQLDELLQTPDIDLQRLRGAGAQPQASDNAASAGSVPPLSVGEAPPEPDIQAEVQAIPQEQGVLTPAGRLILEPSLEYTRSSTNRLVFRGFELVPGIQIGLIEATDADRDTIVATGSFRYGLTDRLEIDGRVPYVYRNDRIEVVQQRDEGIVRRIQLREDGIGDVELGIRYQINDPKPLQPIWVASLRVKSDTGKGPFDIDYDEFGVAADLSTGSGFWAVQPGLSFLLPSDPVVLYGGASYIYQIEKNIDRVIGGALIEDVDPGDAIGVNLGFGFAVNPRFSYSLGYRHNYLFPTRTEIGGTVQKSNALQIGSLALGLSYRVTARQVLNFGFEFGVTEDAPDVGITLRVPFTAR